MSNIEDLKTQIESLIEKPDFNLRDLETILSPVPIYTNNVIFMDNIKDIINIITKDRNKNKKFDINDLVLFSHDINAITTFITSLMLILSSLPNVKLNFSEMDTEILIFKLLIYIFLVILPKQTNITFNINDKQSIINCCMMIYTFLIQSHLISNIISKIYSWFKKEWYQIHCCGIHKTSPLDKQLPKLKQDLLK